MKTNFDFLKDVDKKLYDSILDAQKLFHDEYFNQCVIQLRIFSESICKNLLGTNSANLTFDDMINNLKDKIKTDIEKEFIDDLYFIKQLGNKCAHGETTSASDALEAFERAFEISINYSRYKKNSNQFDKLMFDRTLLITGEPQKKENSLIDKYLEAAAKNDEEINKEELLNKKQGDFNNSVKDNEDENGFKDKNHVADVSQYSAKKENKRGRKKKVLSPKEIEIKEKIKLAKKNLKQTVNNVKIDNKKDSKKPKAVKKKTTKNNTKKRTATKIGKTGGSSVNSGFLKTFFYVLFLFICIFFLCKMIFVFQ